MNELRRYLILLGFGYSVVMRMRRDDAVELYELNRMLNGDTR
jgi:hypothetical protein